MTAHRLMFTLSAVLVLVGLAGLGLTLTTYRRALDAEEQAFEQSRAPGRIRPDYASVYDEARQFLVERNRQRTVHGIFVAATTITLSLVLLAWGLDRRRLHDALSRQEDGAGRDR